MICINTEYDSDTREDICKVVIQADTTPAEFPTTGENVAGLPDKVRIAPASILYCVDTGKVYFMNEAGDTWNPYGGTAE